MENAASSIKAVKEDEKVPEPLSDQVMEALMQVLPEYAKYYVAILVDTGLRTVEQGHRGARRYSTEISATHCPCRCFTDSL